MACEDDVTALADFAMTLLDLVANQAGNERNFSNFKIQKTRLRNRLGLPKLCKMTKVGDRIRRAELADGTRKERKGRTLHSAEGKGLLDVPRYADALEAASDSDDDDSAGNGTRRARPSARLIKSGADWRRELAKWRSSVQEQESDSESDMDAAPPGRARSLIPCTLDRLFSGAAKQTRAPRPAVTEEARYMELLQDELNDDTHIPDDGELEGSGDDYE
ncbi:hypothetical protein EXIGLDRAFT_773631 [Exidia glandulosa HHB12029]|uniref:Uncharacterized protein n=1 Tax=Exidia glandulosa HHB12029 TaxID=1314781 RepID=A0A166A0F8_EXIGL|nr:hypothetical protein EXIGLDRAFT_773631 [Exidia glandulosa HHB12029]